MAEFRKSWVTATKKADLPGVLFHDLRRSGVRNMVRAGVDPTVAMKISGHRTDATFRRYNITGAEDLRETMQKTTDYVSTLPKKQKVDGIAQGKKKAHRS